MKKYFAISLCTVIVLLFYMNVSTYANKGRKYYEEAGQILWEINTDEKVIALTFDDGPHGKYTSEILDLLGKHDAKATFFIVGENAEKNPDVVLRMNQEGHELAIHTYTHPIKASVPIILNEINKTHETIYAISGNNPKLFRPVEGQYTDGLIDAVVNEGYKVVMWSWHLDTLDWKDPGVNKIVDVVLSGAKPGNIILFHDGGGNRQQTVEAIKRILSNPKEQDYRFVTISELLEIQKTTDNDKEIQDK